MNFRKKSGILRTCAAVLASWMLAASGTVEVFANVQRDANLADGLSYTELYIDDAAVPQHEYVFTYYPGKDVLPIVTAGSGIYGRERVTDIAQRAEKAGYTVAGAVNGDFFSFLTGIPMGVMIENGEVLTSDAGANALGIKKDGTYLIGKPGMKITLTVESGEKSADKNEKKTTLGVAHINKYPAIWGAYLSTPALGKTTHSTEESLELVFRRDEGRFCIDGAVKATLVDILKDSKNAEIPKDGFVISVHNKASVYDAYAKLKKGDVVTIGCTASEGWEDVVTAIGGAEILVKDGTVIRDASTEDHARYRNPRTAIGCTADGALKIFVVDGVSTKSGSGGMTLNTLAQTMKDIGCVDAINLDGGGSSTVLVRADSGVLSMENIPSEDGGRKVSNALLFVSTAKRDGVPFFTELTPDVPIIFGNAQLRFSPVFRDRARNVTRAPENASYLWSCTGGTITQNGVFTADGSADPSVTLTVLIPDPDAPELPPEPENPTPEDPTPEDPTQEDPTQENPAQEEPAPTDSTDDADTEVIPAETDAETAPAQEETPETTENPEDSEDAEDSAEPEEPENPIPYGYKIFSTVTKHIQRTATLDSLTVQTTGYSVAIGKTSTQMALRGTLHGFTVYVDPAAVGISFASGKKVLPEAQILLGGQVQNLVKAVNIPKTEYRIYDLTVSAPARSGGKLTASAFVRLEMPVENALCDIDKCWAKNDILSLYYRGIVSGIPDGHGGYGYQPDAVLTRGAFAKLVCLLMGYDTENPLPPDALYLDAADIPAWAVPYVGAVTEASLMRGKGVSGGTVFDVNGAMTRAEVLSVLSALLGDKVKTAAKTSFADDAEIPSWAADAIDRCVAAGIVNGFPDGTVRPRAIITRAEAAALLLRVEDKITK